MANTPTQDVTEKMPPAVQPEANAANENPATVFSAAQGGGTSTEPQPDYAKSIEFLRLMHPGRRWVLTAITLDKKVIRTNTLSEDTADKCLDWLKLHGAEKNIYFSVGEVAHDVQKKAERTDIKNVHYLHADIDPRAGEDIAQEQQRALALLRNPPGNLPPPTCIVFSGGGYQGFWALKEPIPIDCDLAKAEDAKRYNLQIEILLGADSVHNIDRILRVPGTINRPDPIKVKKGRQPALAEVISWNSEYLYDVAQFTKAPAAGPLPAALDTASTRGAERSTRAVATVGELPSSMADRAKVVIVQGNDPDNPLPSQSEGLLYVCCEMVRAGCDDSTIRGVITNRDFRITDHVYRQGDVPRYVERQIERARAEASDPNLSDMNDRFFVIGDFGGKCVIGWQQYDDEMQWWTLRKQHREDFFARFIKPVAVSTNQNGVAKFQPLGRWWFNNPHRRFYDRVVFKPQGDVAADELNLWRGFAFEPAPGECGLFLDFVRDIICSGRVELAKWLLDWMAYAVQEPQRRGGTAVVLRGGQGIGKSFFADHFGKLFGTHYKAVTKEEHVIGRFNAHLQDAVVVFADEAFFAGNRKHASVLKALITGDTQVVEHKGVDSQFSRNCIHLIIASNDDQVVRVEDDDRRYFILDVSAARKCDTGYFGAIARELQTGGYAALLHYLQTRDLSKFDPNAPPPDTQAKQDHKQDSLEGAEAVVFDLLWTGELPNVDGSARVDATTGMAELSSAAVVMWGRKLRPQDSRNITPQKLAAILKGPQKNHVRPGTKPGLGCESDKPAYGGRYWVLPPLSELRRRWCKTRDANAEWPEDGGGWSIGGGYPTIRLRGDEPM